MTQIMMSLCMKSTLDGWRDSLATEMCLLGHSSEVKTLIYLDSIENSVVDHANRDLIKSLGL